MFNNKQYLFNHGNWTLRWQVCKHETVKHVTMVDIDGDVIEACKKYFPTVASSFGDARADVQVGDGVKFVEEFAKAGKEEADKFDVVIIDSSDPVGPAEGLFSKDFYRNVQKVLKKDGVVGSQGESLWLNQDMILDMLATHSQPFATSTYATINVPTYPCGQIGIFLARNKGELTADIPLHEPLNQNIVTPLRYWSRNMHRASFALPADMEQKVQHLRTLHNAVATETPFSLANDRELRQAEVIANGDGSAAKKRRVDSHNTGAEKEILFKKDTNTPKLARTSSNSGPSPDTTAEEVTAEVGSPASLARQNKRRSAHTQWSCGCDDGRFVENTMPGAVVHVLYITIYIVTVPFEFLELTRICNSGQPDYVLNLLIPYRHGAKPPLPNAASTSYVGELKHLKFYHRHVFFLLRSFVVLFCQCGELSDELFPRERG